MRDRDSESPALASHQTSSDGDHGTAGRGGRPRDHTRDGDILDAALDVLAEVGYERMTMDMVALRAHAGKATVYRRWSSKEELVLDAVGRLKRGMVDLAALPDTGTLRGDLIALIRPDTAELAGWKLRVMGGVTSLLSLRPELGEAVNDLVMEPWTSAHRVFLQRAIARGEIAAGTDVETIAGLMASLAAFRVLIQRQPVDRDYLVGLIDGLVLPAVRI